MHKLFKCCLDILDNAKIAETTLKAATTFRDRSGYNSGIFLGAGHMDRLFSNRALFVCYTKVSNLSPVPQDTARHVSVAFRARMEVAILKR